jgi:rsbT antagonist protein RsbS
MERIPILRLGGVLLVTIQVDMHDRLALALQEDLTEKITAHGSRGGRACPPGS